MSKKRILTGHRPTGPRHIGHLAGTLNAYLAPLRERRAEFISRPRELMEVLFGSTVEPSSSPGRRWKRSARIWAC